MTIHDEIIKLRDSASNSLRRVENFPKLTPYGSIYTATLVAGGIALSEVFKFNPHTYAGEDMDGIIKRLVERAGLVEGTLGYVECTEGVLDYLLVPSEDESYQKKFYNGVSASRDRKNVTIPGTGIRYTVKKPEAKRNVYSDWKTLDASVLVVINAVGEWKDEKADEENKKKVEDWLVSTAGDVTKALEYLTALDKLVGKAMTHK
ncbi:predicted ORF [Xanthomonas phage XacN1]|nr:predicted ORF [Xanthomonas phage XacN1]BBA65717.1 predicted ORF [Xanthomonas phage XacN1]